MKANQLRLWFASMAYVLLARPAPDRAASHAARLRHLRHHPAQAYEDRRPGRRTCSALRSPANNTENSFGLMSAHGATLEHVQPSSFITRAATRPGRRPKPRFGEKCGLEARREDSQATPRLPKNLFLKPSFWKVIIKRSFWKRLHACRIHTSLNQ